MEIDGRAKYRIASEVQVVLKATLPASACATIPVIYAAIYAAWDLQQELQALDCHKLLQDLHTASAYPEGCHIRASPLCPVAERIFAFGGSLGFPWVGSGNRNLFPALESFNRGRLCNLKDSLRNPKVVELLLLGQPKQRP